MTTKNKSLLSDTPNDDTQSSHSSASSSTTEGEIDQASLAVSAVHHSAQTRNTASLILKRPRLENSKGNDEASSVESNEVKVPLTYTRVPVDDNTKLYSKPPMENPDDERRRRNAITAWRNRVRKKRQFEELQTRVDTLEETNKKLHDANQLLEEELRAQREELERVHNILTQLQSDKLSLQTLIQTQQEKLAFTREHLLLINRCSEEDSPVRKFLTALLNNMNSSSPRPFAPTSLTAAVSLTHHASPVPTLPPPTTSPRCDTPRPLSVPRPTISPFDVTTPPREASLMPSLAPIPESTAASHFLRNRIGSPAHEIQ